MLAVARGASNEVVALSDVAVGRCEGTALENRFAAVGFGTLLTLQAARR